MATYVLNYGFVVKHGKVFIDFILNVFGTKKTLYTAEGMRQKKYSIATQDLLATI